MELKEWVNTDLAIDIWNKKYKFENETFDEWLDRVSGGNESLKQLIVEKKFLFGGRILANRGLQYKGRKVTFSNCFLPNQKVLTDKGYKYIQDIQTGDKVLTHTNSFKRVNAVLQREYKGEIYVINPRYGLDSIKCTPNHEFLTNRGWVKAEELRQRSDDHASRNGLYYDLIKTINPTSCASNKLLFDLASLSYDFDVEYDENTISTTGIYTCGNNAKIKITSEKVNRFISVDDDLAYVIGRWIGDGCVSTRKNKSPSIVQITFSNNEYSEVIKCRDILFNHFGLKFNINENKKQNTIILRKDNIVLANVLVQLLGQGVDNKHIPDMFFAKSSLSLHLLLGLIDSDGTFTKDGYIKLLSKNPNLAQQIAELSFICGFPCNIKEVVQSYKQYKGYLVSWSKLVSQELKDKIHKHYDDNRLQLKYNTDKSKAIKVINGNYYTQIKSIEKEYYSGTVYNLSVEEDHSYNVNGLIVHNCYVIEPPEDSIESIFDCAKSLARTFSYGGGCGVDISRLAPAGAKVNNAARETTGSVSFMDLYSLTTELIGQNGRRGALMISLDCTHPDLEQFIDIKSDLNKVTKANISVRISDDFMNAVKSDSDWTLKFRRPETGEEIVKTVKARDLFERMCFNNWDIAEPGMLNWSRIENWNLLSEDENFKFEGVNPCARC